MLFRSYYDSIQAVTVTDVEATPFSGGAVSMDLRTSSTSDTLTVDNLVVRSIPGGVAPVVIPNGLGGDIAAAPMIESVKIVNGTAVVSWTAFPGNRYRLQYAESLDQSNWQDSTEDIVAMEGTITATDTIGSSPQRFYRVVLVR